MFSNKATFRVRTIHIYDPKSLLELFFFFFFFLTNSPTASVSQNLVLYTIGPATTRLLTPLRDQYLPHARIVGEEAGTGEKLALIILNDYNNTWHHTNKPKPGLLFLVGEQRRDIIPRTLMSDSLEEHRRIRVDELVVYETTEMPGFEASFRDAVTSGEKVLNDNDSDMWVTIFSPTGCDAVLRVLGEPSPSGNEQKKKCLIVTIGPTTRDHLRIKHGVEPDAVAETPNPEGVGEAIRKFYNNTQ
jgi:uroporphyrinogen-III synthase